MKKSILVLVSMLFALQIHVAEAMWFDNPKIEVARAALFEWQARFVNAVQRPEITHIGGLQRRNFMRYAAKVNYCEKQLAIAEADYASSVHAAKQQDPNYEDLNYKENPQLTEAQRLWVDIIKEVGTQTVAEAEAAFPDKEMLKNLTYVD